MSWWRRRKLSSGDVLQRHVGVVGCKGWQDGVAEAVIDVSDAGGAWGVARGEGGY